MKLVAMRNIHAFNGWSVSTIPDKKEKVKFADLIYWAKIGKKCPFQLNLVFLRSN